jgi:DNA topoisomerase-3
MLFLAGKKATRPGFTLVMPWLAVQDKVLSGVERIGAELPLTEVKLEDGVTQPPDFLSESELIGLVRPIIAH